MARYRKKPVEVEAVRFDGWANAQKMCDWADVYFVPQGYEHSFLRRNGEKDRSTGHTLDDAPSFLVVKTNAGSVRAEVGDFVVQDGEGKFGMVKADVFAATYEPVEP